VKTGKNLSNFFTAVKVDFCWRLCLQDAGDRDAAELRMPLACGGVRENWFETMLLLVYAYEDLKGFVGGESTIRNGIRDCAAACAGVVCLIYTAVQYVTITTLRMRECRRGRWRMRQRFVGERGAAAIAMGRWFPVWY